MRYRTARVAALSTLLALPLSSLAAAGRPPARAGRPAPVASPAAAALRVFLGLQLGLFHDFRQDDGDHGHDGDDHGGRPPRPDPPPEGSGLCPHGEH